MTRTLDGTNHRPRPAEEQEHLDSVGYWSRRDRWTALGRRLSALRLDAARAGRPLEEMPGAPALVAAFKALGKELDRHAR